MMLPSCEVPLSTSTLITNITQKMEAQIFISLSPSHQFTAIDFAIKFLSMNNKLILLQLHFHKYLKYDHAFPNLFTFSCENVINNPLVFLLQNFTAHFYHILGGSIG